MGKGGTNVFLEVVRVGEQLAEGRVPAIDQGETVGRQEVAESTWLGGREAVVLLCCWADVVVGRSRLERTPSIVRGVDLVDHRRAAVGPLRLGRGELDLLSFDVVLPVVVLSAGAETPGLGRVGTVVVAAFVQGPFLWGWAGGS